MAAILKVWHHLRNLTLLIDAYSLEEQYCKFYPNPVWKDGEAFLKRLVHQEAEQEKEEHEKSQDE